MSFANNKNLKPLIFLGCGALMLGLGPVFVRFAKEAQAEVIAFWRMAIAIPFLIILAKNNKGIVGTKEKAMAFCAGIFLAADLACWHMAIAMTKVANATLLIGLAPFWVAFMSALYPGLRLSTRFFVALVICFGGMSMLTSVSGLAPSLGAGEFLSIIASMFYAVFTYLFAMVCKRMPPIHALKWASIGAAGCMLFVSLIRQHNILEHSQQTWLALIGLGLFIQVFAWFIISKSLHHLHATVGSLGLLGQQLATVFFGWVMLNEKLGLWQLIGCSIMLVGMALGGLWAPKQKEIIQELT